MTLTQTVLLRTTLTRTIVLYLMIWLLGSNHLQLYSVSYMMYLLWLDYQPLFREMSQRSLPKSWGGYLERETEIEPTTITAQFQLTEQLLRCWSVYSSDSNSNIKPGTPSSSIKRYKIEASIVQNLIAVYQSRSSAILTALSLFLLNSNAVSTTMLFYFGVGLKVYGPHNKAVKSLKLFRIRHKKRCHILLTNFIQLT